MLVMSLELLSLKCMIITLMTCCLAAPAQGNDKNAVVNLSPQDLDFLRDKGYYTPSSSGPSGQLLDSAGMISALKDFQSFANIAMTGKFDADTKRMMESPRCGMADILKHDKSRRKRRYQLQGTQWAKSKLTWAVENDNDDGITRDQVRYVMQKSLSKWQALTNLEFVELPNSPIDSADIRVRFVRGVHEDSYPFDGKGGTLAHAFYPQNSNTGFAGDVHFDDDEHYTIDANADRTKYKLLWVAVHELGHSLGLEHSNIQGAIMYPWYLHFDGEDFDLTEDDRIGIQSIYGSRVRPKTQAPSITTTAIAPVTVPKSKCTNRVGAALYGIDARTYIYNGQTFYMTYKVNDGMGVQIGPRFIRSDFKGLQKVDAVFRRPRDSMIVFFHNEMFSVYNSKVVFSKPRKISDGFQGLPEGIRDIDAALFDKRADKLYLFKGEQYWRFSERFNSLDFLMDNDYPQRIASRWKGLPASVDAALNWKDNKVYFFKDNLYYRWDHVRREVHSGYPQKLSSTFLECTKGAFQAERTIETKSNGVVTTLSMSLTVVLLLAACLFVIR